jgi:hypothetical protein
MDGVEGASVGTTQILLPANQQKLIRAIGYRLYEARIKQKGGETGANCAEAGAGKLISRVGLSRTERVRT